MKRFLFPLCATIFFLSSCSTTQTSTSTERQETSLENQELSDTDSSITTSKKAGDTTTEKEKNTQEKTSTPKNLAFDTPVIENNTTSASAKTSLSYRDVSLSATSWVATAIGERINVVDNPHGQVKNNYANPTQFGSPRVFHVLDLSHPDYVKVSLPSKPNGQEGWVHRDDITLKEIDVKALVDLRNDSLTVWDGDQIIVRTQAVTGKTRTPTPLGTFYVRDIIKKSNAGGAYGPYIVALSGFSETLETFNGGLPAIAIHGTNQPGLIGQERSNGCIRIPNDLITQLAGNVPLGTPVTVIA